MICILNILFNHPVSEAPPNSKITGAYSPLGQETSDCSGPALNSVNGETYAQENGGRLNFPLD